LGLDKFLSLFVLLLLENIVARMRGDYHETGIGFTSGFIGSHTVTQLGYSVYTLQLTIAAATLL
jgi:hypothetical protein